jgi:hypothetical protein
MIFSLCLRAGLLCLLGVTVRASEPAAARWEGVVEIPGRQMQLVVDLAEDGKGKWTGSVIVPGFGIKGAPLVDVVVQDSGVSFALKTVLGGPKFKGRLTAASAMSGDYEQAGYTAPFMLKKVGPPQVELPRLSTAVGKEFEGDWQGEMTFLGNKIQVKLKLANQAAGKGSGQLTLTGKHVNVLPVDLITQDGNLLSLELFEPGMSYDGQFHKESNEIAGQFSLGGTEIPLTLKPATTATIQ